MACKLHTERGLPIVGVPKTIDNDIEGTEVTFGFNTAVQIATDAIDRLHTTAESHDRVMVVEVMGRHSGWIATHAGIAGGATVGADPRAPVRHRARCATGSSGVTSVAASPRSSSSPKVPSRARARSTSATREIDQFGHVRLGGIGAPRRPARSVTRTGFETRPVLLGHVQRGGTPTAYDRVLSTRFGVAAIDAVHRGAWGTMVALRADQIVETPLVEVVGRTRPVDIGPVRGRRPDLLRLTRHRATARASGLPTGSGRERGLRRLTRSPGSRRR